MTETDWQPVPERIASLEELATFLNGAGKGGAWDLGGRHLRNLGGYAREYGYEWTELPLPHWRLPFLGAKTRLRNGELRLSPRVQLVCSGKGMIMQGVTVHGAGNPEEDERNSFLVAGGDIAMTAAVFEGVGVYVWDGSSATLSRCSVARGLHCLYVRGPGALRAFECKLSAAEGSIVCARDRARVTLQDCELSASKGGSGLWAGEEATIAAEGCRISGNSEYAAECTHVGSSVKMTKCVCEGNPKGVMDEWDGGSIKAA